MPKALNKGELVERLNVALDRQSREDLETLARERGMNISQYLRVLIREEKKRAERRKP